MKHSFSIFLLSVLMFAFACNTTAQTEGVSHQTTTECEALIQKEGTNLQILDVRTPQETANGIIKGAFIANFYDADFKTKVATLDKDKPVLVYCAKGGRSADAANVLQSLGFTTVIDMKGGMSQWQSEGKAVVK